MLLVRGGVKREKPDRQGNNFCKVIIPLPVRVKREKPDRQGNNLLKLAENHPELLLR